MGFEFRWEIVAKSRMLNRGVVPRRSRQQRKTADDISFFVCILRNLKKRGSSGANPKPPVIFVNIFTTSQRPLTSSSWQSGTAQPSTTTEDECRHTSSVGFRVPIENTQLTTVREESLFFKESGSLAGPANRAEL